MEGQNYNDIQVELRKIKLNPNLSEESNCSSRSYIQYMNEYLLKGVK